MGRLRKTVEELQVAIKLKDTEIVKLTNTIAKLKNTPLGTQERKRELCTMHELAPQSGAQKKRIMATRYVVEDSRIAKSTISTVISYLNFIVFCLFCRNFLLDACGSKED